MKKLFLIALAALLGIGGMKAQNLPANVNEDMLRSLSPVPGKINLDVNESGLMSLTFNPAVGYRFNTGVNVYCTLSRNGQALSNVQACNNIQITYDTVMFDIWTLSFFTQPNPQVKVGGTYQVKFDEGFFVKEDGTLSPEILLYYYIDGVNYYVLPEEETGKLWPSLHEFTITFPGAERVVYNEGKHLELYDVYFAGATEDDENTSGQKLNVKIDGNTALISTESVLTTPGTWWFTVEEDTFTAYYADGSEKSNGYIRNIYQIPNYGGGLPEIYPEPGEVDYFPGTITFDMPKGTQFLMTDNMSWSYLYPVNPDGTINKQYVARFRVGEENKAENYFTLVYYDEKLKKVSPDAEIVPAPGQYVLSTPNMLYRVRENGEEHSMSAMNFYYTVVIYDELPCTITPESGSVVETIKQIKFEFDEGTEIQVNGNSRASAAWLTDGVTNYLFNPFVPADAPSSVIFNTPVIASLIGKYKFTSGAGQVVIDGIGRILTADYTISGETGVGEISNVVVLPEVFDVYSTQGILLKKNADVEYLRALPAGIYVAGGQKYVVK